MKIIVAMAIVLMHTVCSAQYTSEKSIVKFPDITKKEKKYDWFGVGAIIMISGFALATQVQGSGYDPSRKIYPVVIVAGYTALVVGAARRDKFPESFY